MAGRVLTSLLNAFGVILYKLGAAPLVRWLGRKNPKVLLYHDCAEFESAYLADLDCTTSPARFTKQLKYIVRYYDVVDLETIVMGQAKPGAVAITFDDGYRSVYDAAFPILRSFGLPATIYLITDVVGNEALVWVNELNFALREQPERTRALVGQWFSIPESASVVEIISHCRIYYDPDKMRGLLESIRIDLGLGATTHAEEAALYLDWQQVAEMERGNITFGNHTRSHPNMARLSAGQQKEEIIGAQTKLARHLRVIHSFAHPFGHRGSEAAQIAIDAGARCAVDVGGANRPVQPLGIGRVHISNQDIPELFARMEVVEPIKEGLRRIARFVRPQAASI